jgi:hypothetical protein
MSLPLVDSGGIKKKHYPSSAFETSIVSLPGFDGKTILQSIEVDATQFFFFFFRFLSLEFLRRTLSRIFKTVLVEARDTVFVFPSQYYCWPFQKKRKCVLHLDRTSFILEIKKKKGSSL